MVKRRLTRYALPFIDLWGAWSAVRVKCNVPRRALFAMHFTPTLKVWWGAERNGLHQKPTRGDKRVIVENTNNSHPVDEEVVLIGREIQGLGLPALWGPWTLSILLLRLWVHFTVCESYRLHWLIRRSGISNLFWPNVPQLLFTAVITKLMKFTWSYFIQKYVSCGIWT